MNKFIKNEWFSIMLLIIPFIIGIILYPSLPDQMPTHWNFKGEVDQYSSRNFGTFFFPALNVFMYLTLLLAPKLDPKKENYEKFATSYKFIRVTLLVFLVFMYILTLYASLGYKVDMGLWISVGVSLLFIGLGNVLGRVRHNYFVGIRLPWTLANEKVWKKTHYVGSKAMVAGGVFSLLGVILTTDVYRFIFLMVGIFVPLIFVSIYSYVYYKKLKNN
ncbi:Uncharacterized membrane protein [Desulfonispora thiosulfatigenes DSM 11270]|uniref:Uncharacterized membrane protein n=1 Tax=Desulfonispora thiosulfatigenes DSM 11270 TaxID=656914 RepID=A0A1W1UL32_DESTI|nr:DUF1648 domain-containing protein [Desulfonispora thiosulfatigenes]SMB81511.1 Uncharacterized membrane protein [Desulfonispora thiosulfatigenes DSM 11270]